jgi:outer membrane biosynthesis protein TonB
MYVQDLSAKMLQDRRKSFRTSAIIHIIIILLAILPFLKSPLQPKDFKQAILVEFKPGSSSEGSQQAAPQMNEESSAAAAPEETVEEREVKPETKPIEMSTPPPVLTSKIEPPVVNQTKVRKIEIKTPPKPTENIPQQSDPKPVPTTTKPKVDLKPSKVKKVVIKVERPTTPGTGSSSTSGTGSGNGKSDSDATGGGAGTGGAGNSKTGNGKDDGLGQGDKGSGKSDAGDGSDGSGDGTGEGDGILMRKIIDYPDLSGIIKESGKLAFNVCVNRQGKVSFIEYNEANSTIIDRDVIRGTMRQANEYLFEADATAPERECGLMIFKIKIEL